MLNAAPEVTVDLGGPLDPRRERRQIRPLSGSLRAARLLPLGTRRLKRAIPGLRRRHAIAARSSSWISCRHRLASRACGLGPRLCHRGGEGIVAGCVRAGAAERSAGLYIGGQCPIAGGDPAFETAARRIAGLLRAARCGNVAGHGLACPAGKRSVGLATTDSPTKRPGIRAAIYDLNFANRRNKIAMVLGRSF